jgi:RNA polymerase sigma-70 factor (ECF subfamily)
VPKRLWGLFKPAPLMDDKNLIKEILTRNEGAFCTLIEKYKKLVYHTVFRIVRDRDDADDLFQEVFLEVFRSVHHLRNENDLSGWIFRIARKKSLCFLRKKNPAKVHAGSLLSNLESNGHYADRKTPARMLEDKEASRILFAAIDRLPDMQRKVLLMHKFEDRSHQEIGEMLNLTRASVESLIYRAKYNLRRSLHSYFRSI